MIAVCGRTISTGTVSFAMAAALLASASLFFSPAFADPIHDATKADDVAQVEQLIAAGTDIDERDVAKKTALYWAVELGHTEVAELLVVNGADVNAKDFADTTPLHAAGDLDREAIAELLIASGADVNALDKKGLSVLDIPAMRGHAGIIEMLQRAGAECGTNHHYSKSCREKLGIE